MELAKRECTIYIHTNTITKMSYIGLTIETINKRWNNHVSEAFNQKKVGCPKFHNAIRKYGKDSWEHEILAVVEDVEVGKELEIEMIAEYGTVKNGYNLHSGGGLMIGEEHPNFEGYYITPEGKFTSANSAAKALNTTNKTIRRWCREFNHTIVEMRHVAFNKYLDTTMLNKSFRANGFGFEPA